VFGPIILLTVGVAILDEHTRLARLEKTNAFIFTAIGTTGCLIFIPDITKMMVHVLLTEFGR
jgi:hypothetical protein